MGNKVKEIFSKFNISPKYLIHESVITSEDAAKTRGFELKQGIKALLFTNGKNEWVIVDIPADLKVDQKKVAKFLNWSNSSIRMANSEEVLEKTGCEIGAVPPFGHKEKLRILIDKKIYDNHENAFNIGLRTHSVKILSEEVKILFKYLSLEEGDFYKQI
jgi:prolyl-tRNA editing enzyme YbaK/EbsC (Cys-tRNA(Pro) deacylase)